VILDSVSSKSPCIVMKDDGCWNISHSHRIRLRGVMTSSPKWTNRCEGHVTTQEGITRAGGLSPMDVNRSGRAGVRRLPQILTEGGTNGRRLYLRNVALVRINEELLERKVAAPV
jgi:hypothetical protein